MLKKVIFVGRHSVETCGPWADWAVISLTEPCSADGEAKLADGWHSVLRLEFHDITKEEEPYQLMDAAQAQQIVDFVRKVALEVEGVIVHCRAGISRSAAVAKWICGQYRIPFSRSYDKWNAHVYGLLCEAGPKPRKDVKNHD